MSYLKLYILIELITHSFFTFGQSPKCITFVNSETKLKIYSVSVGMISNDIVTRELENKNNCFIVSLEFDSIIVAANGYDDLILTTNEFIKSDTLLLIPEYQTLNPAEVIHYKKGPKLIRIGQRSSFTYSEIPLLPNLPIYATVILNDFKGRMQLNSFDFELNSNSYITTPKVEISFYKIKNTDQSWTIEIGDVTNFDTNGISYFNDTFLIEKGKFGWYSVNVGNIPIQKGCYVIRLKVLSNQIASEVDNWAKLKNSRICQYDVNCICLKTNSRPSKYFGPYFFYKYPYSYSKYNYYKVVNISPRVVLNLKKNKR